MEEKYFDEILEALCNDDKAIRSGKMMSSKAIVYQGKVFAFFSREKKMVFKLGKDFDPRSIGNEVRVFNPFTNRPPLNGWFEIPVGEKELWLPTAKKALKLIMKQK